FTGSFPEECVLSLCQKYLGNLPLSVKSTSCKNIDSPEKIISPLPFSKTFYTKKNMEDVLVELVYTWNRREEIKDWKEKIRLEVLSLSMTSYLYKKLRYESEEGNTYATRATFNSPT